ncbi:MAG: DNA polymerase III subunit gamma/tau [Oscillospiraceae bacterium]|jgi:DNA polymerase-3 subunit gamma/tau|nr:DNA polymerase III subunit gamma/tau [Oscillospiraceae bacterium]
MYQALYRKWRPRTFDDVSGQEHVTGTLKRQVASGRLSHAYLFVGTRGTGKTSCAKILARAVNCESPRDGNPCNECPSCRGIESGAILDVLELDAASNNRVDDVRSLLDEVVYTPASVARRVYIIDEVHMMTSQAFSALLQMLEEPPEHLIFILATTEVHKVPATIVSRCQRFSFKRIPAADIAARLEYVAGREGFALGADASGLLARLADGSMRDALSLLDQCAAGGDVGAETVRAALGLAGENNTVRLASAILDRDAPGALSVLDEVYDAGGDMAAVTDELSRLLRDCLIVKLMPTGGQGLLSGGYDGGALDALAGKATGEHLYRCLDAAARSAQDIARGLNGKLAAELYVAGLCLD